MGEDIKSIKFQKSQRTEFMNRVQQETKWLENNFKEENYIYKPQHGYELEGYLVDQDCLPALKNKELLAEISDESFVHEIAKFNWEINGDIFEENPHLLKNILEEMNLKILKANKAANKLNLKVLFIGILPTLREEMLTEDCLSDVNRYYALAEQIFELRKGKKLKLSIDRNEIISLERSDIMTEAAATSLQIHTQVKLEDSTKMYNLAQIISAPMIAATANSPFFLGKKLWDETRIPIFEQAVQFEDIENSKWHNPVTLGRKYYQESIVEIFEENQKDYPAILPFLMDDPIHKLRHLKLLNGQVWRWNRPIITTDEKGKIQFRIEHRPTPAGPTSADMVANIAFYLGLINFYKDKADELFKEIDFDKMKMNFYETAKMGMKANIYWGKLGHINVQKLLYDVLFEQSKVGLTKIGISKDDINYFMDQILKPRLQTGFTGAAWQKSFIDLNGTNFQKMTQAYYENQQSNKPVHSWKI